jgi:hypothetical protein
MLNGGLALELAWGPATPGREAVERDQVLREIHRLLIASARRRGCEIVTAGKPRSHLVLVDRSAGRVFNRRE